MINFIFFIFILLSFKDVFSEAPFDLCERLEDKIIQQRLNKQLNLPEQFAYDDHGFSIERTFESDFEEFNRTEDNYLTTNLFYGNFYEIFKIPAGSKILELNHKNTAKLTEEEIEKIWATNKSIHAKFEKLDTKEVVDISSNINAEGSYSLVGIDFDIADITNINSKDSSYRASYSIDLFWDDENLLEIIQNLKNEVPDDYEWDSFTCTFSKEDFENLKIFYPRWDFQNLVTLGDQDLSTFYQILYFFNEDEQDEDVIDIIQKNSGNSIFKTYFDFSSFPFDKQNLNFTFLPNDDGTCFSTEFFLSDFSYETLRNSFEKVKFSEWNKSTMSYQSYFDYNQSCKYYDSGVQVNFFVERNYNYFLTKILIPIFLILIISWSVFWIRPNLIEPRLTVSIVCLLSLIAYNFVVDDDLPKLSYLTVMDLMILLSYFFSTLPTLLTIVNHVQSEEIALKIDRVARYLIPLLYIISIFIINGKIISTSKNTISAFKFMG